VKLLFDENLSHKLVGSLADLFPDSEHVRNVGLKAVDDRLVWEYAAANDLLIVSKDSDFYQRSLLFGHPPNHNIPPRTRQPDPVLDVEPS